MGTNEIYQTSCFTLYFAKFIYNLQLVQKSSVHGRHLELNGEMVAQAESRRAGDQLKQTVLLEQIHKYYIYIFIYDDNNTDDNNNSNNDNLKYLIVFQQP